jgi:putative oxidoreductase
MMAGRGMPMADLLVYPATAIVLVGGLMLLVGWKARWAALALIVFLIVATLYFHNFWAYPKEQFINQFFHFFKNLGLMGALFMIMGMGPGPMSLDYKPS